ncbi:MAG: hypothetical protein EOM03_19160, partial [Clostridia bacterium]|nr:hypothetical protein [Clostridia bacterium]
WFETGTPTFLVDWLKTRNFFTPKLEGLVSTEQLLFAFDVDALSAEAMLWQTGYLTIKGCAQYGALTQYQLAVPNAEVRSALNEALLHVWHPDSTATQTASELYQLLAQGDAHGLRAHFERLYAAIPADWDRKSPIAGYEGYFASVFYSHLACLGLDMTAEDNANQGRVDLTVRLDPYLWLFEFKLVDGDQPTGEALAQLLRKDYAAKYRKPDAQIVQINIEFSKAKRQIVGWEVA